MSDPYRIKRSRAFASRYKNAADYYAQTVNLDVALRFAKAVDSAITKIAANPHIAGWYVPPVGYPDDLYMALRVYSMLSFSSFPYSIYYRIDTTTITLVAFYHHAQHRDATLISDQDP